MKLDEYRIKDRTVYVERMQKSVFDKLFFTDKIFEPISTIVDFGCANGGVIKALHDRFPTYRYIGYDVSAEMLAVAQENIPFAELYVDWDRIQVDGAHTLLNLSSVLHEVYSYGSSQEIARFWERVYGSGFRYIAIRDMMLSESAACPADNAQYRRIMAETAHRDMREDFETVWGPLTIQHNLVHYLLKYRYAENWERELRENYLPLTVEQLKATIPEEYEIVYQDHFTLPYIAWQVKQDFYIDLTTPTHIKMILRKKD